jgi:hypothetical protein
MRTDDDDIPGPEPSLDEFVKKIIKDAEVFGQARGWADLDQRQLDKEFKKQQHEQQRRMRDEAMLFRDVLWANEQGRQLLELLLDLTLRRRTWPNALMIDRHAMLAEGIWREAENCFVAAMLDAIATAENQEPKGRE